MHGEPGKVKLSVNKIMKDWTQKWAVLLAMPNLWACQYAPLDYVNNDAFSGVINSINMSELILGIKDLPDDKSAELSGCLLGLLNTCLEESVVPALWKRVWVSMISKPYDWDGILTNTHSIVLIKMARKIFFKILLNRIYFACSKFGVLCDNNFLVLKSIFTQSSVFAVKSIIKNAFEKNKELWLVLASLYHIKMCNRFIEFFGGIHKDRINRVMTDFGFSNGYRVHDGFDQGEIFLPLLWRIFYDSLLCEIKRHEHFGRMFFFFAAGAFVDDMIWIGNCQASMHVKVVSLSISNQPISIAKKREAHRYLGIFLLTNGLFKPSLAKAYLDVWFFVNIVLSKTITNNQFFYLVLAVLQPIVSYRMQFSFVLSEVCHKWDIMVRKSFKSKVCLPHDFLSKALHYFSLYGLKPFKQMQSESKIAAVVSFSNASDILGHLFLHCFLDLQVFEWAPLNFLQFSVKLLVSSVNNFLAGIIKIFLSCELFLANNLSKVLFHGGLMLHLNFYMIGAHCHLILWVLGKSLTFGSFDVYTDNLLKFAGSANVVSGAAAYFFALNMEIGVGVCGLFSFIMAELQAVALSLKCVPFSSSVVLYLDSQAAIDMCVSEIKSHSGIPSNTRANVLTGKVAGSFFILPAEIHECFLMAENSVVSSNACHFIRNVFCSICHAHWKTGSGYDVVSSTMLKDFNWSYPSVLCLLCGEIELPNHVFTCAYNVFVHNEILSEAAACLTSLVGVCDLASSTVLRIFAHCSLDVGLYSAVCKEFVLKE
ncbi:hypothetical protein G9A89_010071 [Geosiphon pyriformis]|nr:hypothetical protein G9A89_010071 [Geosiphon pyriformis]